MSFDYETAVKRTFVESLRSVFLVDDSFPTYEDMFEDRNIVEEDFTEWERARKLYSAFRERHLPCDIENSFTAGDTKMVERLRKCDLIVIDFHLDTGSEDASKSIEILRKLADSPHFNTVIVYTNAELDEVWLDIAANLRPDLRLDPFLDQHEREAEWWYDVDETNLEELKVESIVAYMTRGMAGIDKNERRAICEDIRNKGGKGKGDLGIMAEMFIRSVIDDLRPESIKEYDAEDAIGPRSLQGRFSAGKPHWLQSRGCFIAIVKKTEEQDEVGILMESLTEALLDWNPNFLQILVSEIQNRLELDLVATNPKAFSDASRQIGLSHYLMEQLANDEDPDSAVENVVDRIVETIRHGIAADVEMRDFATDVLSDIRKTLGAKLKTKDQLANAAALAHVPGEVDSVKVLSFLNAFLSTERFVRSRITTGTIFSKGEEFWMVSTPACDLTSRVPTGRQAWMKSIHPVRALTAIRLQREDTRKALAVATEGRHAFVVLGEEPLSLAAIDAATSSPDTEIFFVLDAGKVGVSGEQPTFRAVRIEQSDATPKLSDAAEYIVIGQLRPNYASRMLQVTGAHLSRIGIDFFKVGGNTDA